jgi:hypothetical protein
MLKKHYHVNGKRHENARNHMKQFDVGDHHMNSVKEVAFNTENVQTN